MFTVPVVISVLLAGSDGTLTVVATDFARSGDVKAETASFIGEHFAQRLSESSGVTVNTSRNIEAVLGAERQRQLLGCDTGLASCVAELAGALGADAIIVGELAQLERSLQLNLRIVDGKTAKTLFSSVMRGATTEELIDRVDTAASDAALRLAEAFPTTRAAPHRSPSRAPWLVAGAGAAAVVAGVICGGVALGQRAQLNGTPTTQLPPRDAATLGQGAAGLGTASLILVGVGAAAVAAGVAWALVGRGGQVTATVAPTGVGAMVEVSLP